jgi:protein gp37
MGDKSSIEWTDATWNPVTGCDRVSRGCDHCYALTLAARLKSMGQPRYQKDGNPRTSGPGFGVTLHSDVLTLPLRWTRPRRIFVNSMSDLFHPKIPDSFIARAFAVMAMSPRHTFQILTKRAPRARALLTRDTFWRDVGNQGQPIALDRVAGKYPASGPMVLTPDSSARGFWQCRQPLPNVWLGVSVEDQDRADQRIPALLDTPAAVRWLSMEPLLGPVELPEFVVAGAPDCPCEDGRECLPNIDWVVVGGESGPNHRPCNPAWVRAIRDQCIQGGIPFFLKQWGGRTPKAGGRELDGRTWDEYPARPVMPV